MTLIDSLLYEQNPGLIRSHQLWQLKNNNNNIVRIFVHFLQCYCVALHVTMGYKVSLKDSLKYWTVFFHKVTFQKVDYCGSNMVYSDG